MDGYKCSVCPKVFSRQEHVRRHEQSHKDPEYRCHTCSKSFHRKDALTKHEHTHRLTAPSLLQRRARACSPCSTSKSRCSGSLPCARCVSKKLHCSYPVGKSRGPTIDSDQLDRASHSSSGAQSSQPPIEPDPSILSAYRVQPAQLQDGAHENTSQQHHQMEGQPVDTGQFVQDPAYYAQASSMYPLDTNFAIPATDWTSNMVSTINWLQSDIMNFDENDLNTLFPVFPGDLQFSPSIDFPTPIGRVDLEAPSNLAPANVLHQHSPHVGHRPPSHQQGMSNASPVNAPTVGSGEYYVDGDSARLPKSKRRKVMPKSRRLDRADEPEFSLECKFLTLSGVDDRLVVLDETYAQLCSLHRQLCLEMTAFKSFSSPVFPTKVALAGLLSLYFANFDQTMPFLHFATFNASSRHCALLLAMVALGSSFVETEDTDTFTLSMHEFVRRYLILAEAQASLGTPDFQTLAQIQLLHAIGAGYTLYEPLRTSATRALCSAAKFCRDNWTLQNPVDDQRPGQPDATAEWMTWVQKEESNRTGFCIWMLDCLWASQFHQPPYLNLDDATAMALPCPESFWATRDALQWTRLRNAGNISTVTLLEALRNLYIDKRLLPNLGEFSRILLIYGLFHRTWEVKAAVTQSLSSFEPTAQKQASSEIQPKAPVWPPSVPLFNRWRNSACDCLDILHWSANATVMAASGMEHPTVLHLHLARLVLLTPLQSIVLFSQHLISSGKSSPSHLPTVSAADAEEHRRLIQRWAMQDQYKARLAAIHAGVVFWHVRLYSINAFYEPTTVAFAALVFWALSAFSLQPSKSRGQSHDQSRSPLDEDSLSPDQCDIILIDRPTDDELVQQFVRQGHTMRANITGVGNLFSPAGPRKVLAEGQKLLLAFGSWRGITDFWIKSLSRLEKVTALAGVNNTAEEASAPGVGNV